MRSEGLGGLEGGVVRGQGCGVEATALSQCQLAWSITQHVRNRGASGR